MCGLTACSMLFTMPALAWAADEPQNTNIDNGLIAYYDFENVNEKKVPNVKDQSKYEGELKGSNVSIASDTIFGKSLKFTEGTEGTMEIPQIMNTSQNSYSISLWFKYDTNTNREGKNTVLLQQSGQGRTFLQFTKDNKYATYVNATNVYSDKTVDLSQWQHVMATYNKDTKKIAFYINGEKDSEKDAGNQVVNELTNLLIGRHKNAGNDPLSMRGLVDEIRVYDKVLTAEEAKAVYESKAGAMLFPQLQETLKEAKELDALGSLDTEAEEAKVLKEAIAEAEKLTAESQLSEISETIKELEEAMKNYRAAIGVVLTVSPTKEERSIEKSTIGINHRYAFNGYGSFDSTKMEMKEEFTDLYKEAGFGSIRYPGGTISNLFRWKESIGPKEERVNQIHGFYNNPGQGGIAPNFGLTEVADFAYRDDIQSEIVYVYGFGRGSAQDAADLVLRPAVHDEPGVDVVGLVHAHVQRAVAVKTETAFVFIQLQGGHADIQQRAVHLVPLQFLQGFGEPAVAAVEKMRPPAERGQTRTGQIQSLLVAVQAAEFAPGRGGQHGGGMAAHAQGAVQIATARARGQSLQCFGGKHRHMTRRRALFRILHDLRHNSALAAYKEISTPLAASSSDTSSSCRASKRF